MKTFTQWCEIEKTVAYPAPQFAKPTSDWRPGVTAPQAQDTTTANGDGRIGGISGLTDIALATARLKLIYGQLTEYF